MLSDIQDTILAVSSPPGTSYHSIIKISGPETIPVIGYFFEPDSHININREALQTFSSLNGEINLPAEFIKVPVLVYIMKQPYSYTKEDVAEIHTFGAQPVKEMLLQAILSSEAGLKGRIRLSQPGEFTQRAFLHGRLDLAQAEAVNTIIRSQTDHELNLAIAQLSGNTSQKIKEIQDEITGLCTQIEAAIDFADQDIELISAQEIEEKGEIIQKSIFRLLKHSQTERLFTEGIHTVLYGIPNVGKSSLINALLGKKRVLVSTVPGTTRDVIANVLEIGGVRFKLFDLAGMDDANGEVLFKAKEKAHMALKDAHVILFIFDCSGDINRQFLQMKPVESYDNVIVVMNKCDLLNRLDPAVIPEKLNSCPLVYTSALTGEGMDSLKAILAEKALTGKTNAPKDTPLFGVRQKNALMQTHLLMQQALESCKKGMGYEFIALDLRMARDVLGEIVGEVSTNDVLDKIFSDFCIGK